MLPGIFSSNKCFTEYVEDFMNACREVAGPNLSHQHSSNGGNKLVGNLPAMNALDATFEKPFATYPVTDTSGSIVRRRDLAAFAITESVYPRGLILPQHCHSHAYLSFVLAGTYMERYANRECICSEGALRFLPPSELHENDYGAGARCLLVKIEPSALERLGEHSPVLSSPGEVAGLASSWLANRLYREFAAEDDVAPLAMEGVLLEILAESARAIGEGSATHAPAWLRRVKEAVEDTYLQAPSLADLAAIAGVHPVHLSREFRKHYQSTIGEYIRKRRIEHACKLLVNSGTALSEIALTCGFSDQSHFCAMFKGHTGLTPAKFRDMSARA
jgi:AraC family transcriptional regulator